MDYTLQLIEITDKLNILINIGFALIVIKILQYVKGMIKGWRT